jgi:hypothetical protein
MSQPGSDQIAVALGALRNEAQAWLAQQDALGGAASTAADMLITAYVDTTVFDDFLAVYNTLARLVTRHCADGAATANDIARTLVSVADEYEADEAANLHTMQSLS